MKLKNGQLIIYEVNEEYLNYLSSFDINVKQKSNRRYTGILISNNNMDYCLPLTSQIKKRSKKLTTNIFDGKKIIAQLTLNNMIPVRDSFIKKINIKIDRDKDYLNKEVAFLRKPKIINSILAKAENILMVYNNEQHNDYYFFKKLCANFSLLEEKCFEYERVEKVFSKTNNFSCKEELYYVYEKLDNYDDFEKVIAALDNVKAKRNINVYELDLKNTDEYLKSLET